MEVETDVGVHVCENRRHGVGQSGRYGKRLFAGKTRQQTFGGPEVVFGGVVKEQLEGVRGWP